MKLIESIDYFLNPLSFVANLINAWNVSGCSSEKECENSLYTFLHEKLPDIQVVQQYGRGRSQVDLMIDDKVMVELKYMLESTSEFQRLVGQLIDYKTWDKQIIIVLVGATEPSLLKQLRSIVKREFSGLGFFEEDVLILEK